VLADAEIADINNNIYHCNLWRRQQTWST